MPKFIRPPSDNRLHGTDDLTRLRISPWDNNRDTKATSPNETCGKANTINRLPSGFSKHGWLENPLNGGFQKTITDKFSSQPRLIAGGYMSFTMFYCVIWHGLPIEPLETVHWVPLGKCKRHSPNRTGWWFQPL